MKSETGYWYSVITAAPNPEAAEQVNVGIVIGNGRITELLYEPTLPRLACLVPSGQLRLYSDALQHLSKRILSVENNEHLHSMLGVHLRLGRSCELLKSPGPELVRTLKAAYLEVPPRDGEGATARSRGFGTREIRNDSLRRLDRALNKVRPLDAAILKRVTPSRLYEEQIPSFQQARVPSIARVLRGFDRDVLIEALTIDDTKDESVRRVASRVSEAFFAYRRAAEEIHERTHRTIQMVGVLQAPDGSGAVPANLLRDWVRHFWSGEHTSILDGDPDEISLGLMEVSHWATSGSK